MRYRLLGNSGLRVSEAALGTMTFGDDWGWGSAKDEARKVYDAFREAGAILSTPLTSTRTEPANRSSASLCRATGRAWCWPRNTAMPLRAKIQTRPATIARVWCRL